MESPYVEYTVAVLDGREIRGAVAGDDEQGWLGRYRLDDRGLVINGEPEVVHGKVEFRYLEDRAGVSAAEMRAAQLAHALAAEPPASRTIQVDKRRQRVRFEHETEDYVFVVIESK